MNKIVIIINGRGGVGKDTLCDLSALHYPVRSISAITPIKEIATECGWNGEKNDKTRKFLSDLKQLLVDFNDYPTEYLVKECEAFKESDQEILFVHIREGAEIDKLKARLSGEVLLPCVTLLIKRSSEETKVWGNASDDEVENYEYDYSYDNCKSLKEAETDFTSFLASLLNKEFSK